MGEGYLRRSRVDVLVQVGTVLRTLLTSAPSGAHGLVAIATKPMRKEFLRYMAMSQGHYWWWQDEGLVSRIRVFFHSVCSQDLHPRGQQRKPLFSRCFPDPHVSFFLLSLLGIEPKALHMHVHA